MSGLNTALDCLGMFDPNWENLGRFGGDLGGGSTSVSQSLVWDNEKDELVKASVRVGKRSRVSGEKMMANLKSHSEAERRRRERINTHLNTLRRLVPCTEKMDKATLLAEVISQVKQMKKTALELSEGLIIPMDDDEIRVEPQHQGDCTFLLKATLSCEYSPELLHEIRQSLNSLHLNIVKAEISTLGNRVRNEFTLASKRGVVWGDTESCQLIAESVHRSLSNIVEKMIASAEYTPRTAWPNKRKRVSFLNYS